MGRFFERIRRPKKEITIEEEKKVPEDYWFEIGKKLYEKLGKVPDPLQIRAQSIVRAFRIPSFPYSSIERKEKRGKEKQRQREKERERDKIIAEYLTNRPGVWIDKEKGIISSDFRDLYPNGLPRKLKRVLSRDTLEIMEVEYKHLKAIDPDTEDEYEADRPIHYFRLPGGIDLFMKGYRHSTPKWQKRHGEYLKKMNEKAKIICIEGFPEIPFGESLELRWDNPDFQKGDYDKLMKDAFEEGFGGFFTEIDARRDVSKIEMDHTAYFSFPDLPHAFFSEYFKFLEIQHPKLAEEIGTPEKLKKYLIALSITDEGALRREKIGGIIFRDGKQYWAFPYITKEGKTSFKPTLFELGQHLFSDALAAIKLHLIARLMAEGKIEKGPIIDYEGAAHLSSKTFFLKHPEYAMEVVLRTINELMAGRVEEGQIEQIYDVFRKPNWQEAVKEIAKLVFKKPSPNGKELLDEKIDFLETFNLDPEKIIPSDEQIEQIREKIRKSAPEKEKIKNA